MVGSPGWQRTEGVGGHEESGKKGKEGDGMEGTRANAARRDSQGCSCVCLRVCVCVWANCTRASGRLRDMPPPLLRAAGFWQQRRCFCGRRGGDERKRVGEMDEGEEGGFPQRHQPCGRGGVTSGLMGCAFWWRLTLRGVRLSLTMWLAVPTAEGGGRQPHMSNGGVSKSQFAHITKPALCCFFCAKRCLGDLPKVLYHHLKLCLTQFFIFWQLCTTHCDIGKE